MKNTWFSVWTLLHFFSPCFLCRPRVQNQLIRQNEKLVFRVLSPGLPCVRTFFFFLLFPLQHNTPAARLLCFFLKIFGYVVDISHRGKRSIVAGCAVHSHIHTRAHKPFMHHLSHEEKQVFLVPSFEGFFFFLNFAFFASPRSSSSDLGLCSWTFHVDLLGWAFLARPRVSNRDVKVLWLELFFPVRVFLQRFKF